MTRLPKVSVIIPVYSGGKHLPEAVQSALALEGVETEVILVDDQCLPDTKIHLERLIRQLADLKVLHQPENLGPSAARNTGLKAATGEFVLFLDDDDLITPHCLVNALRTFEAYPTADVVIGQGNLLMDDPRYPNRTIQNRFRKAADQLALLPTNHDWYFLKYSPPIHAMVFRRSVFAQLHFEETLRYGEDRLLWLQMRAAGCSFAKSKRREVVAHYRIWKHGFRDKTDSQIHFFQSLFNKLESLLPPQRTYTRSMLFLLAVRSAKWHVAFQYRNVCLQPGFWKLLGEFAV